MVTSVPRVTSLVLNSSAGGAFAAADLAVEDDLDGVRAAEVEVVGDAGPRRNRGRSGGVEDDGAGDLDLRHRQLPPVARVGVGGGERQREPRQPALEEHVDRARAEPVADRLQRSGIVGGGEPVGQLGELQTRLGGVAFGPFVSVDPDLDRPRAVGADLDERRTEVGVPEVEIEDR